MKRLFLLLALILFAGCATTMSPPAALSSVNLNNSYLAADIERSALNVWKPKGITEVFSLEDNVYIFSALTWLTEDKVRGYHKYRHKWYSGNKLISKTTSSIYLNEPSLTVVGSSAAASLGIGKHYVELIFDGNLIVTKHFEIKK